MQLKLHRMWGSLFYTLSCCKYLLVYISKSGWGKTIGDVNWQEKCGRLTSSPVHSSKRVFWITQFNKLNFISLNIHWPSNNFMISGENNVQVIHHLFSIQSRYAWSLKKTLSLFLQRYHFCKKSSVETVYKMNLCEKSLA